MPEKSTTTAAWPEPHCECPRTDHLQFPDGRCHRTGDGAEQMTNGKVQASPAMCLPCLFACTEDDDSIDVTLCPDCNQQGSYEQRVLINGRGFYTCPAGHRWQDANEKPTNKGIPIGGEQ